MSKLLSIIIPSYNVEKYIRQTIETLTGISEINKRIEVIVINDGSKDKTSEIAHEYERKYPETVKVVDKVNGGHGSGINVGIEMAEGKYIKVVDGDDYVKSSGLQSFIEYLECLRTEVDLIINPYERVSENGIISRVTYPTPFDNQIVSVKYLNDNNIDISIHSVTFRKELFTNNTFIPKLDEKVSYDDMEYILYPIPSINSIVFQNNIIYQYRVGLSEQSTSLKSMQKNIWMHEKIIESLSKYYIQNESRFNCTQKEYYLMRLEKLFSTNCNVILSISDIRKSKECMINFLSKYRSYFPEIRTNNRKIKWLINNNFKGYAFLNFYYRKIKLKSEGVSVWLMRGQLYENGET